MFELYQSFLSALSLFFETFKSTYFDWLPPVFSSIAAFSLLEWIFAVEKKQSLRGRLYNLSITVIHMAISALIITLIARFTPIYSRPMPSNDLGSTVICCLQFFLVRDFIYYWYHRAQHKFAFLWAIHELHHTDSELNSTSSARTFWAEGAIQRIILTMPTFTLVPLTGDALAALPLINTLWHVFTHLNLPLRLGHLTPVICGPQLHRIHHSTELHHRDKNFAQFFPIWDVVFGTYYEPDFDEFPPTGVTDRPSSISLSESVFRPLAVYIKLSDRLLTRLLKAS